MLGVTATKQDGFTTVVFSQKSSEPVPEPRAVSASRRTRLYRRGLDQALRTVAVLQTTLDLDQLIKLFSREVSAEVPHSSIQYQNESQEINIISGRAAKQIHTFELIVEDKAIGQITFSRGKPFSDREAAQLEYMLCSLVYPLRNALQYKRAFRASMTDPLTGIYNRSVMESALNRESGLALRHKTPLSLIILDIDNFKHINDTYGHQAGDELIIALSQTISKELRKTDMLARYGGDEFTILLSNTDRLGATTLANNLRKKIESTSYSVNDEELDITVSIGVSTSQDSDNTSNDLFLRADEALYQAKREGRNRVQTACD
ncbi:MAG: GGDEF domain-containing protein [Gammaproteobacteria bacterium]|nr:GGDEF domain-containing protein [Gammaproteobacteria bacterium]